MFLRGTVVGLARVYTLQDFRHGATLDLFYSHDAEVCTGWKHEEQLCVEKHALYKYQTSSIVATQKLSCWRYSYTNKTVLKRRDTSWHNLV